MTLILITVEVEEGSEHLDPDHPMGITNDAYERLTGITARPPLAWLGEIQEIEKAEAV